MPVILLLLGIVTAVAGLLLVAPGVTIRGGTPDTAIITPGIIAAVGGLLLIGMALVVRALQRIERALAAHPTRADDARATDTATPDASVRIPFPPRPKSNPQPSPPDTNHASVATEDATSERWRGKFADAARLENAPVVEGTDISLMPHSPARAEDESGDLKNTAAVGRGGNGASPARVAPRFELRARPVVVPDGTKGSVFKSAPRARRASETAPPQAAVPPPPVAIAPAPAVGTAPEAGHTVEGSAATAVLKSGVVEGMAYTLYADGSIEARLPQGTMRFGSITALRNHIENAS